VRQVIEYVTENWRDQPSLEAIAERVGMESTRLQKALHPLGRPVAESLSAGDHARPRPRVAGAIRHRARSTYEVGLSGPGRLHDLFVTHEAVTPGSYRARGEGLTIATASTLRLLQGAGHVDGIRARWPSLRDEGEETATLADMMRRWPKAEIC